MMYHIWYIFKYIGAVVDVLFLIGMSVAASIYIISLIETILSQADTTLTGSTLTGSTLTGSTINEIRLFGIFL